MKKITGILLLSGIIAYSCTAQTPKKVSPKGLDFIESFEKDTINKLTIISFDTIPPTIKGYKIITVVDFKCIQKLTIKECTSYFYKKENE
tara:strand:- start:63 stop:332 length:270 start_codon:yes stop_codon:yes gene_type:complete